MGGNAVENGFGWENGVWERKEFEDLELEVDNNIQSFLCSLQTTQKRNQHQDGLRIRVSFTTDPTLFYFLFFFGAAFVLS